MRKKQKKKLFRKQMLQMISPHKKISFFFLITMLLVIGTFLFAREKQVLNQFAATSSDLGVDFGNGQNHTHSIPTTFFGVGQLGVWQGYGRNTTVRSDVQDAGIGISRVDVNFSYFFSNAASATDPGVVDWTDLDNTITFMQQGSIRPLLILDYTPSWLVDTSSGSCSNTQNYAPANLSAWAGLAKQVVAHIDAKFPGVQPMYEIWNEPDGNFLCATDKQATWMNIYAATAPVIKQQAAADGQTIMVGGPALGAKAYNWVQSLTTDARTAPYVDFVSYHHYGIGTDQPDSWDGTYTGPDRVVYHDMQDATVGYTAVYKQMDSIVRAGSQPNAATTPIFVTEENANSGGSNSYSDCCNNNLVYGPLFNSLVVSDLLNSVYQGATQLPGGINYYHVTSVSGERWCMFGTIDAGMDCSTTGTGAPYPAYYAYQLLGSNTYLGMKQGGYLANSVSSSLSNVSLSAFYTPDRESVLVVNAGPTAYTGKTLYIQNPPGVSSAGNVYTITTQSSNSITTQSLVPQRVSDGYVMSNLSIPAYTVVGISLPYTAGPLPTLSVTPAPCNGLTITSPLSLNKAAAVPGDSISGTVTYTNECQSAYTVNYVTIASRDSAGANKDFSPAVQTTTLQPGQTVTVNSSRTIAAGDPTGQWYAFASYQDASGTWHADTNNVYFTVAQPTPTPMPTATPTLTPMPVVTNVIQNSSFENTGSGWLSPWVFTVISPASGSISHDSSTKEIGNYSVKINISKANANDWYMQLSQSGLSLTGNRSYTVTFWAKASSSRTVPVTIMHGASPWTYYTGTNFNLTTSWKEYSYSFTAPQTDANGDVVFNLAKTKGSIWFDAVSLQ